MRRASWSNCSAATCRPARASRQCIRTGGTWRARSGRSSTTWWRGSRRTRCRLVFQRKLGRGRGGMRRLIAALAVLAGLVPLPAFAHPHIFFDATAAITFNDAGQVVAIHNTWVFDEAYSAWSIQGLDTNGDGKVTREELQPLADDNMNGLADYEYYTFAGEGKDPNLKFSHGSDATLDYDGKQTPLSFDVALAQPYAIRTSLELSIDDPEYNVALTFHDPGDIQLITAPK